MEVDVVAASLALALLTLLPSMVAKALLTPVHLTAAEGPLTRAPLIADLLRPIIAQALLARPLMTDIIKKKKEKEKEETMILRTKTIDCNRIV